MSATTRDARFTQRRERQARHAHDDRLHKAVQDARRRFAEIESRRTPWYEARFAPGYVSVHSGGWARGRSTSTPTAGGPRRFSRGWSGRSQGRFRTRCAEIRWPDVRYIFLTLTYPEKFPADPREWKRQLRVFRKALERHYGPISAVWAMEFQQRGAPHFHIVFIAPDRPLPLVRRWCAATWHRVVTSCSGDHERASGLAETCVPWHYERHLDEEHCKEASGARDAIRYLSSELTKSPQKRLPAYVFYGDGERGGRGAGHWWGRWRFRREVNYRAIRSPKIYAVARRALCRLRFTVDVKRRQKLEQLYAHYVALGKPWTGKPPSALGRPRLLILHSRHQGVMVRDPELRPDRFARAGRAMLDTIEGAAARGSLGALDLAGMLQKAFGWA